VGHQHDGGVECLQVGLEPLERGDVEVVGGLVKQEQVGVAGERARERGARQLAAREGREPAVELALVEPESPDGGQGTIAPVVAAAQLEALLGPPVGGQRWLVVPSLGHGLLEPGELCFERGDLLRPGQHVVAQAQVALGRGTLVVEGDLGAPLQREGAAVDRRIPGQHAQQRGLARAVAPGQGQAVAALELERDPAQQPPPGDVLAQIGCDHDGHVGRRC